MSAQAPSKWVRKLRDMAAERSMTEIAIDLSITPQRVVEIMRNQGPMPDEDMIIKICEVYDEWRDNQWRDAVEEESNGEV